MKEQEFDKVLNIKTTGDQMGILNSFHYHRYEPTPYSALEELFLVYELKSSDCIVDFGCGKGRLNFYLNYQFNAKTIGIEMNQAFFHEALENRKAYLKNFKNRADKVHFECCLAEEYKINPEENKYYFFNPFTVQIFMKVINNILLSSEKYPRRIEIILYYPANDYIFYLENQTPFEVVEEVILADSNPYERFLIYGLPYSPT